MSCAAHRPPEFRRPGAFSPAFLLALFGLEVACVCAASFPCSAALWALVAVAIIDSALARVPVATTLRRLSPLLGFAFLGLLLLVLVPPRQAAVLLPLPWEGRYLPVEGVLFLGAVVAKSVPVVLLTGALASRLDERGLLEGLTALGLPPLVVGVVYLTVRSLRTVGDAVGQLVTSRDARGRPRGLRAIRVAAAMAEALIVRTGRRAEVTGLAMAARGFSGRLPLHHTRRLTTLEAALLVFVGVTLIWIILL